MLQWGHRLSAMERVDYLAEWSRNTLLQWGHRLSAMERLQIRERRRFGLRRFNGATAFRRWKAEQSGDQSELLVASMRPPPFGDGKPEPGQDLLRGGIASIGPPPFGDGKNGGCAGMLFYLCLLQWGHRLSAMESLSSASRLAGNSSLQWGHRLSAMERMTSAGGAHGQGLHMESKEAMDKT